MSPLQQKVLALFKEALAQEQRDLDGWEELARFQENDFALQVAIERHRSNITAYKSLIENWESRKAGGVWSNPRTRPGGPRAEHGQESVEERLRIIADYGAFLERRPRGDVWDVKCLPHDKGAILDAIYLEIVREADAARRGALGGGCGVPGGLSGVRGGPADLGSRR
ncbi:MAG TPA: hypothetical protein VNJ12_11140 [Candidatus Dormibacteraeota bacterium]|nr:hypothetical protein [Candidatus Dormibacteraeota bacterium]